MAETTMVERVARAIVGAYNERVPVAVSYDDLTGAYLDSALACARAAIAAAGPPDAGGWRPIESAPQSGRLLAIVDGEVRVIAYGKTSHVPIYGWCLADQGAEEFDLCKPSCWMSLPPTPQPAGLEEGEG